MAGVDLKTVQELLGRKTFEMTLRYSHLSPDHKRRAIEVLGRRMDTIWTPEEEEGDFSEEERVKYAYIINFKQGGKKYFKKILQKLNSALSLADPNREIEEKWREEKRNFIDYLLGRKRKSH